MREKVQRRHERDGKGNAKRVEAMMVRRVEDVRQPHKNMYIIVKETKKKGKKAMMKRPAVLAITLKTHQGSHHQDDLKKLE